MLCSRCGSPMSEGARFCAVCGGIAAPVATSESHATPPPSSPGYPPPPPSSGGYAPDGSSSGGYAPPAASSGGYAPLASSGGYAPPAASSGGYAPPAASSGGYAPPAASSGGYAPPAASSGGYAPPGVSSGGYAPPGVSSGGYAPPGVSSGGYAPPASFPPPPASPISMATAPRASRAALVLAVLAVAALSVAGVFYARWHARNKVLVDVVEVEKRWNLANIKGDRKILAEVLSDGYHHETKGADGKTHVDGKKELIASAEAKPGVQKWELKDVHLTGYTGDRATLTGVFIEFGESYEKRYDFTDTFELKDGRWQAVDSQWSARSTVTK